MIALRRHEPSDAARMAELLNDETISAFTSDRVQYPFTLEDAEKRIQQGRDARSRTSFVITCNDELVGEIAQLVGATVLAAHQAVLARAVFIPIVFEGTDMH